MKRTKRLSIEIEHREVTMIIGAAPGDPRHELRLPEPPKVCPVCGSPALVRFIDGVLQHSGSRTVLSLALASGEIHMASYGKEIWLCEESFQRFNEKNQ